METGCSILHISEVETAKAAGYDYIEMAGKSLVQMDGRDFWHVEKILYENNFLCKGINAYCPESLIMAGPGFDLKRAEEYARLCAGRAGAVGVKRVGIGSPRSRRLPEGYQTHIEQGGSNVSGGQRQRLCIARALLKKPKILILDDSTSAVDTATDAKIRKAFCEEIPDTTKLIIAQRITSVKDADRIIVMEEGCVDGFGTHEELLAENAIYREVYESQTNGGGDFDEKAGE